MDFSFLDENVASSNSTPCGYFSARDAYIEVSNCRKNGYGTLCQIKSKLSYFCYRA